MLLARFAKDDGGAIQPSAYIIATTILVFGAIVGLTALRNSIIQELGDAAVALQNLNQSFITQNSTFIDVTGADDREVDSVNNEPGCISVRQPGVSEQ